MAFEGFFSVVLGIVGLLALGLGLSRAWLSR